MKLMLILSPEQKVLETRDNNQFVQRPDRPQTDPGSESLGASGAENCARLLGFISCLEVGSSFFEAGIYDVYLVGFTSVHIDLHPVCPLCFCMVRMQTHRHTCCSYCCRGKKNIPVIAEWFLW